MCSRSLESTGDLTRYLKSGIIESYVLGIADHDEAEELKLLAAMHEQVRSAISDFCNHLEEYVTSNAVKPHPSVKPLLMKAIDSL